MLEVQEKRNKGQEKFRNCVFHPLLPRGFRECLSIPIKTHAISTIIESMTTHVSYENSPASDFREGPFPSPGNTHNACDRLFSTSAGYKNTFFQRLQS